MEHMQWIGCDMESKRLKWDLGRWTACKCIGENDEITCNHGWRMRLHVTACRSIIAYEKNGCNVACDE